MQKHTYLHKSVMRVSSKMHANSTTLMKPENLYLKHEEHTMAKWQAQFMKIMLADLINVNVKEFLNIK